VGNIYIMDNMDILINSTFNFDLDASKLKYGIEYGIQSPEQKEINWNCLNYGSVDYEFFAKKFPPGFQSIPGFDEIIQKMVSEVKTPLQEMEDRLKSNEIYNGDNSNFSELKDSR